MDLFEDNELLVAYDRVLPLSEHYISVLSNHLAALSSSHNIVDLGCGTGILTLKYLESGKTVTGVDISKVSLAVLRDKAANNSDNLTIVEADSTNLDMLEGESFDGASSMIAAHLISDYEAHVREGFRLLKPDGMFVITARAKEGDQTLLIGSTKDSLIALGKFDELENDFNLVSNSLLMTASERSPSLKTLTEATTILNEVGFVDIKEIPNKTLGVMYTLIARKPNLNSKQVS